jgi:lysophospholipase L1-like esterase
LGQKGGDQADGNRFFSRAGKMVVSVLVVFLVAEGITRLLDTIFNDVPLIGLDEDSVLYMEHPYFYKVPQPGARFERYEVNKHGFRGREFELPKPSGVYRVLILGGSSAWDSNVSGTDATWAAQLEDLLKERRITNPGLRYEVVNGGVPGHNSAESLMNFIWRGLPIDPDAVLVYHGYNDFKPNRFPGFQSDYSHFRTRDNTIMRALAKKCRILYHIRRWISRTKPKTDKKYDVATQPGIDAFTENLRKIAELAKNRGIQPLFATFAMPITMENRQSHPGKFRGIDKYLVGLSFVGAIDAHKKYNAAIKQLGRELTVPVADVDAAIPRDFEHFTDHAHFTDKGSALMAKELVKIIP